MPQPAVCILLHLRMKNTEKNHHWFVLFHSEFGSLCSRKGNREFKANKQVIKDGTPGGERALKSTWRGRCCQVQKNKLHAYFLKLQLKSFVRRSERAHWKGFSSEMPVCSAIICVWNPASELIQSELRSNCSAPVITEGWIDTTLKADKRLSGILKDFTYWSVCSQTDSLWLLSTPRMTVHPGEGWYTKSMNQTNKT